MLALAHNRFLEPIREQRDYFAHQREYLLDILKKESRRMRQESEETLALVQEAMGLGWYQGDSGLVARYPDPIRALEVLAFL